MPEKLPEGMTWPEDSVECLLLSAPNLVAAHRLEFQLIAAGIDAAMGQLGLRINCREADWRSILRAVAQGLSPLEQRDTRVAIVGPGNDPMSLQQAAFRAHPLPEVLNRLDHEWILEVVRQGAIQMHYQPLVQYPPGRVHGYECLMRGIDEGGRLIPPLRMFEAARTMGCIPALDWMCRIAAIRSAAPLRGTATSLFVNLIPSAILDPRRCLVAMLDELERTGLRPGQIVLEVIETDRVHDQRHLVDLLRHYRKAGFKVALDDVGAGYASLLSVARLRPDYIKIEGELVRQGARCAMEAKIVRDLAETARQNGIITVAEGIETEAELRFALSCGIRITQGYYHARPAPELLSSAQARQIAQRVANLDRQQAENLADAI